MPIASSARSRRARRPSPFTSRSMLRNGGGVGQALLDLAHAYFGADAGHDFGQSARVGLGRRRRIPRAVTAEAAISVVNLSGIVSHIVRAGMPTRDVEDMLNALPSTLIAAEHAVGSYPGYLTERCLVLRSEIFYSRLVTY